MRLPLTRRARARAFRGAPTDSITVDAPLALDQQIVAIRAALGV